MKKRVLIGLLSLLLLVSITFGACANAAPATTTSTAATTAAPQKVLKVGALIALNNAQGIQEKRWFDLFAKLYNDQGGWQIGGDKYQVQMFIYDTQNNAATAKDELTRLVLQDGCKFILGGTGTAGVDVTVTEPNKVIVVGSDMTDASADPKVQYYYTAGNYFANALEYKIEKDIASTGIKSYVSVKPDNQMGHFIDNILNASWQMAAPGVKNLGTIFVDPTTVDYGPVGTKVKSLNPDCADINYLGMVPNSVPQFYRAVADVGWKGIVIPGIMSEQDVANLSTMVGKAAIEGGEAFSQDPRGYQTDPRMLSFMDAYAKEYGKLETDGTQSAGNWFLLEDAINATKSVDVDTIKNYLDNSKHAVRTIVGFVQLFARPDLGNYRTICGAPSHPIQKIHDGKLVNFATVTIKDQYLFSIVSNGLVDKYKAYWAQYGYPTFPADEKGKNALNFSDLGITGQD